MQCPGAEGTDRESRMEPFQIKFRCCCMPEDRVALFGCEWKRMMYDYLFEINAHCDTFS